MPQGLQELVSVPMAYRLRHLPPKRRQAVVSTVCEETVHRVVGWSEDETPAVARVRTPGRPDVVYRAARLGDGSIRLVAPLDSAAFRAEQERDVRPGMPPLSWVYLFRHPSADSVRCQEFKGLGDSLGTILAAERQAALARTAAIVKTLVVVDGCLHGPCTEPGWLVRLHTVQGPSGAYYDRFEQVADITAIADPCGSHVAAHLFLPFCAEPEQVLKGRFKRVVQPLARNGEIEQFVPAALGGDHDWRGLRDILWEALHNDPSLPEGMLEEELALRRSLFSALQAWPGERDTVLERAVARMVRTVHGIKSNGNADLLAGMLRLQARLADRQGPPSFAERMRQAGLVLPEPAQQQEAAVRRP